MTPTDWHPLRDSGRYAVLRHQWLVSLPQSESGLAAGADQCPSRDSPAEEVVRLMDVAIGGERGDHFDWLFEGHTALATWAVGRWLPADSIAWQSVIRLPDHRPVYLDYEGEISGQRGWVSRVEAGEYELLEQTPQESRLRLSGGRSGELWIHRGEGDQGVAEWRFCFHPQTEVSPERCAAS